MENDVVKKANEKWQIIANNWAKIGPTAKPSTEEIDLYKAITLIELADKKKVNVVICGSTPELRDMCSEYFNDKIETMTCVDATEDMYQAMSKLVKIKNPKEKFVHGNWLELSKYFEKESVDIILGDHIVSNVGGKEDQLFNEIKTILKNDGCFVSKIQHIDADDERVKVIPAYDKLKDYAQKYEKGEINLKTAFTNFGMYLLFSSFFLNKENQISFSYWEKEINELAQKVEERGNKYEREILDMCEQIWWNWMGAKWTQYEKPIIHKMIEENFYIKDEVMSQGHELVRQTSIYRLKKK